MKILKDFLLTKFKRFTEIDTTAVEHKLELPTSAGQHVLADILVQDLTTLGYTDIVKHPNSTVFATLPGTLSNIPTIAFIIHMDTAPGISGRTKLQIHENYSGGNLLLNAKEDIYLKVEQSPEIQDYIGDDILTSDGLSLLGADDKAAIAEVLAGIELLKQSNAQHGTVKLVFVPDEEVGLLGAKALDVKAINADFAYTLDCCAIGEYVTENWNAGSAHIQFTGKTAHPMSAKGKMRNALIMAQELMNYLPKEERPEHTEKREGYFWVKKISGETGFAEMYIDIREFDDDIYIKRKSFLIDCVDEVNKRYGNDCATIIINDVYSNIAKSLAACPQLNELVLKAMTHLNITPKPLIMRGGFDGTVTSHKGLPTGNFFVGAHNFHSIYEYLPVKSMEAAAQMVCEIIRSAANQGHKSNCDKY